MAEDFTFTHADAVAQAKLSARKAGEGQRDFLTVTTQQSVQKSAAKSDGKPSPGDFTFSHYYDKASPILAK